MEFDEIKTLVAFEGEQNPAKMTKHEGEKTISGDFSPMTSKQMINE